MLVKTGVAVLIAAAAFVAVGLVVPDRAQVERQIEISAPRARVLSLAAEVLGCGPGHVSPAAGCAFVGDGLKRRIAGAAEDALPDGLARIEVRDTSGGVLAVFTFETTLRDRAPGWRKPFAVYRGLLLQREVGAVFQHRLEVLKRKAETLA